MTGPRISVAMATYNGSRYIQEQLDSLAAQTCLPYELVVCDDGSTDSTVEIVRAFAATARFAVRVFRNPQRRGFADNFLHAAHLCEGDWIAFCDQDDVWTGDKLQAIANVLARHQDVLLVAHPAMLVDQDLKESGKIVRPATERLAQRYSVSPWTSWMGCGLVFRSELVQRIQYTRRFREVLAPPRIAAHDTWIIQLAQSLGMIYFFPSPLVLWRRHDGATTITSRCMKVHNHRTLSLNITDELANASLLAKNRSEVFSYSAALAVPPESTKLQEAAQHFAHAARILSERAEWRDKSGARRVRTALRLYGDSMYWRMGVGIVGWRGAIRDAVDCAFPKTTSKTGS